MCRYSQDLHKQPKYNQYSSASTVLIFLARLGNQYGILILKNNLSTLPLEKVINQKMLT